MKSQWKTLLSFCALLLAGSLGIAQTIHTRPPDQNTPPPYGSAPSAAPNLIPAGTTFLVHLTDKLETDKMQAGKKFEAKLDEDLAAPNGLTIPRGRKIKGHVSQVDRGLHGRMLLSFDQIETQHGWMPLIATVTGVPGEHGVKSETGPEGEIEKRGVDKRRAVEAGVIGAAVGAGTGAIAGGSKGAAIGAAAGGGLGVGAGILTDRNLRLNKGQELELRLDRGLQVPTH